MKGNGTCRVSRSRIFPLTKSNNRCSLSKRFWNIIYILCAFQRQFFKSNILINRILIAGPIFQSFCIFGIFQSLRNVLWRRVFLQYSKSRQFFHSGSVAGEQKTGAPSVFGLGLSVFQKLERTVVVCVATLPANRRTLVVKFIINTFWLIDKSVLPFSTISKGDTAKRSTVRGNYSPYCLCRRRTTCIPCTP